jgi:hypothetical protein
VTAVPVAAAIADRPRKTPRQPTTPTAWTGTVNDAPRHAGPLPGDMARPPAMVKAPMVFFGTSHETGKAGRASVTPGDVQPASRCSSSA